MDEKENGGQVRAYLSISYTVDPGYVHAALEYIRGLNIQPIMFSSLEVTGSPLTRITNAIRSCKILFMVVNRYVDDKPVLGKGQTTELQVAIKEDAYICFLVAKNSLCVMTSGTLKPINSVSVDYNKTLMFSDAKLSPPLVRSNAGLFLSTRIENVSKRVDTKEASYLNTSRQYFDFLINLQRFCNKTLENLEVLNMRYKEVSKEVSNRIQAMAEAQSKTSISDSNFFLLLRRK